jgi:hypothetical protein
MNCYVIISHYEEEVPKVYDWEVIAKNKQELLFLLYLFNNDLAFRQQVFLSDKKIHVDDIGKIVSIEYDNQFNYN